MKRPDGFDPARRGHHVLYRQNEINRCPGCGRTHWLVGRQTAECAFCATALPLEEQRPVPKARVIGFKKRPGTGPLE